MKQGTCARDDGRDLRRTSKVSSDQHEVGVDHGQRRADIPPEVVGALRMVHAEVEIRELGLGHPHNPVRHTAAPDTSTTSLSSQDMADGAATAAMRTRDENGR